MENVFSYFLGFAILATVAVIATGIISLAVHGDFYMRNANKMMRLRVIFQGSAIAIIAFIAWVGTF